MAAAADSPATAPEKGGAPFVRFRDVRKSYDGQTLVISDLNLDIARGEFLTLLGPSGSGKTTTLMMLAGFETATGGEILVDGENLTHLPPHKRGLGMVFQNYALFPHMTVAENLAFPLQVRKVAKPDIETRVKRALAMVAMTGYEGRRPAQLSGGQQQRVALARALVFEPSLVLMDEPLGALDKQLREHMQYEIKRIHDELGVTMVYVTHDQQEALTMSDRIAVFRNGAIQQLDAPDALYERPRNAFVARFIGENNRLRGKVTSVAGGRATVRLPGGRDVAAVAVNVGAAGAEAVLSIRPERVRLGDDAKGADTTLPGTVADLVYLGDHIRARVSAPGCDDFIVKLPNRGRSGLARGAEVTLGWMTDDCRALDAADDPMTGDTP